MSRKVNTLVNSSNRWIHIDYAMAIERETPVSSDDSDVDSPVEGHPRLVWKPSVTRWYPCVRGTEISTYLVGRLYSSGIPWEQIKRTYNLADDDIRACVAYARTEQER